MRPCAGLLSRLVLLASRMPVKCLMRPTHPAIRPVSGLSGTGGSGETFRLSGSIWRFTLVYFP